MISNGGTATLGLYDFKRQVDSFGEVNYFQSGTVYLPNARVMLANGGIVKNSTNANLTNNPNTDMTGWKYSNSDSSVSQGFINSIVVTPYQFGGVGDGIVDDTQALISAFSFANTLKRNGILSHIKHTGATVDLCRGKWNLQSISTSLLVECDVKHSGAEIFIPASYAGTVFTLGLTTSGNLLSTASIDLPDTNKPTGSSIVSGSNFVTLVNINASSISFGRSDYFDTTYNFIPVGQGVVYCEFHLGQTAYANTILRIVPQTGGWVNTNNFYKGNFRIGGDHITGKYHLYIDGTSSPVIGNSFYGTSWEGAGSQYVGYIKKAYSNNFYSNYVETQSIPQSIAVSATTITAVAHGYSVNDVVMFFATTLPTGMYDLTKYFVVSVTSDTFSVSLQKNGTPINFTTTGTSVKVLRQGVVLFDGSDTYNNKFINTSYPPSGYLGLINIGGALNNGDDNTVYNLKECYQPNDLPLFATRNTAQIAGLSRPAYAAYPPNANPTDNPQGWTCALSDQGLIFSSSGTKSGRIYSLGGRAYSEGVVGTTPYQLAPIIKNESFVSIPASSSVPANNRLIFEPTVTGAAVGDFVSLCLNAALPLGIVVAWYRVRVADSVQFCLHNTTASAIDVSGIQMKFVCIKGNV